MKDNSPLLPCHSLESVLRKSKFLSKMLNASLWDVHMVDIKFRHNGQDVWEEADWIVELWRMARTACPSPASPPAPDVVETIKRVMKEIQFGQIFCSVCDSYDRQCGCNPSITDHARQRAIGHLIAALSQPKEGEGTQDLTASPLPEKPTVDDLISYGYAFGNYCITCISCNEQYEDCEKRAPRCRDCATRLYYVSFLKRERSEPPAPSPVGPAPLTWTKEKPKVEGWYWVGGEEIPCHEEKQYMVRVYLDDGDLMVWWGGDPMVAYGQDIEGLDAFEWAGPIPKPAPNTTEKPE